MFFALRVAEGRDSAWTSADRAANRHHSDPVGPFFSASDGSVLLRSLNLGPDRGHAHSGGARNRRMAARMARTIAPVTVTSASRKVMARA